MIERLKTAIPLLLIVALSFLLPPLYAGIFFVIMASAMLIQGCHEAFTMMNLTHSKSFQICTGLFAFALIIITTFYMKISPRYVYAMEQTLICLYVIFTFILVFKHGPTVQMVDAAMSSLGIFLYICWCLLCMAKIYFMPSDNGVDGRHLLANLIICTKMADVGAYFFGSLSAKLPWGNHKLASKLSPKKSWEGLAGGIIFASGSAVALCQFPVMADFNGLPILNNTAAIICGVVVAVVGLLGDLAESAIKRSRNYKDSGKIPGIGGMLDVLDSLIPVAPLFYAYLLCITD